MPEGGPYRSPPPPLPPVDPWEVARALVVFAAFFVTLPVTWPIMQGRDWLRLWQLERGKAVAERDAARVLPRLAHVARATRWIEQWHTMASGLEEEEFVELTLADGSVLWVAHSTTVVCEHLARAGVRVRERRAPHGSIAAPFVWLVWMAYVGALWLAWRSGRA